MTNQTMEDLLKKFGSNVKGFTRGQKIEAKVIELNKKSAVFDVGGKSEGVLHDIYFQEARDYLKTLKVGDTVNAVVMDPETSQGVLLLSLRHAASNSLWERLQEIKTKGTAISVSVKNSNQSGILVDFEGVSGFIPTSHISKALLKNLESLDGSIRVKIIEIDKSKRKVVFSEKAVSEAKEMEEIDKAISEIKVGDIYEGTITTSMNFGVFVEIMVGKISVEGLVHLSELSWEKTENPTDGFEVGKKVKVKVIDVKGGKIAFSIKQAMADPWQGIEKKFKVEDKIKGKVVRNSDFGTFVELTPGVEGLIHITKIPPATNLKVGDVVNCYIEEIDIKNKKIALGLILSAKPIGYK